MHIRTHSSALIRKFANQGSQRSIRRKAQRMFSRRRRRIIRFSLLTANFALLLVVIFFVANAPNSVGSGQQNNIISPVSDNAAGPLDQLSSADIAVHVAFIAGLPEATSVANHADTITASDASSQTDNSVVAKPQVVATALPSAKDIHTYVVEPGDTVSSIAAKAGVSSDSVRWSNGLTASNTVQVGKTLVLPPPGVNGIVYTVKSGDTAESLAQRYNADKDLLISFNDAEVSGIKVGQQILVPNGVMPAPARAATTSYSYYSGFSWGGNAPIYGRNSYDYGWCTYYAASRVAVPSNWGNANTWDSGARASGWTVSPVPRAGAVAQTDRMSYWGHVAYVEEVNADATMIKYSDMNGIAGWGRVGHSGWVPASTYQNYLYR